MPCLTGAAVLSADDMPRERVDVPEWGEDAYLFVKTMTAGERDKFDLYVGNVQGKKADGSLFSAKLVAATACDEEGKSLFSEANVAALAKKNANALGRVVRAAQRLNGLTLADFEAAKKNSETTQDDSDSSESPAD